jgi:hypothetical protein
VKPTSSLATICILAMMMAISPAQSQELSQRELRQLFPGKFVAYAYGVARINLVANPNGTVFGKMGKADTGRWWLQGNVLCLKFKRWLKARKRCGTVSKRGDWYKTGPITFKKV